MSAAAGPVASAAAGSLDLSKYTVYFTGILADEDKDLIFEGNLSERPGSALVKGTPTIKQSRLSADDFKGLIRTLVSSGVCAENVDPDYIFKKGDDGESVFDKNPIRILVYGPAPVEAGPATRTRGSGSVDQPVAFLIGRFKEEGRGASKRRGVYIEIICAFKSIGIGTPFLIYFHKLATTIDLQFVQLSSLASVVTYYPRLGYRFRFDCDPGMPSHGTETLEAYKLTPSTRRVKDAKGKPVWASTTADAMEDEDYFNFLYFLHSKGLTVKNTDGCGDLRITKKQFKDLDCAVDGFKMALCDLSEFKADGGAGKAGGGARRSRRRRHPRRTTRKHK